MEHKISKVLLVNPRSINVNEYPPLGLLSLAAFVRSKGYEVDLFDESVDNRSLDEIIESFKPEVFGFSLYTANIAHAYETIDKIKTCFPESLIVVGGPHASALPEYTMQECPQIDCLVCGEGELAFLELLESLNHTRNIEKIYGLCVRTSTGNIILNPPRERIKNLDELPLPAFDLAQNNDYRYDLSGIGEKIATIVTSRGCPFSCVFCNRHVFGNRYYKMSPKKTVQMIKYLVDNRHSRGF